MTRIAIIGGTGVYDPRVLDNVRTCSVETPYGEVDYTIGEFAGQEIAFLARHGSKHSIPPHLINYRANIWALKKIGVESILATTAVGSLVKDIPPGQFVLIDQFIDFTHSRVNTFYEGGERGVVHVDLTTPYCPELRKIVAQAAKNSGLPTTTSGTYVCTEGPRFETPAEISMFAKLGGHVVGMTNIPEAVLAREAEMCYMTISLVTNYAAGISSMPLTHSEVLDIMKENTDKLQTLLLGTLRLLHFRQKDCTCYHALKEYGGFKL
ncbi:MAG: methylthioadenosine phosphorylase [Firmicutes bacterium]|nr:methylthioadenosine phosphorylase [Bacillota bacterium]